jgi:mannose-6-phosphate isomerase
MSQPVLIDGVPRHYEWGSPTAIPGLMGRPPDGRPVAELWFGDHPGAPSAVPAAGTTLDRLVAADPETMLGTAVTRRFGTRLPFLLKILAADKALSIQVHPTRVQARAGFDAEDAAAIPRDAAHRNYRDANHKPELLCALTPFDALCGFRPRTETLAVLATLGLPELAFVEAALHGPDPLRDAFTAVLTHPDPDAAVRAVTARVAGETEGPLLATRLVAEDCDGDVGVLLTLLLNYVHLAPGEGIYLDAGNIHAYLRGTAVEIMANSDNVLRCGLTPKHIDVPELLRIADFAELAEPRWPAVDGRFDVPVPDFRLTRLAVDAATTLHDGGPQIVLCTAGGVGVDGKRLAPGQAVFVPAATPAAVDGRGVVFVAAAGG